MIKLRKGRQVILVPTSAYEKIYKADGWLPFQKRREPGAEAPVESVKSDLLDELESLVTVEELKDFAAAHEIDVEGLTTRRTIKAAIREALEH